MSLRPVLTSVHRKLKQASILAINPWPISCKIIIDSNQPTTVMKFTILLAATVLSGTFGAFGAPQSAAAPNQTTTPTAAASNQTITQTAVASYQTTAQTAAASNQTNTQTTAVYNQTTTQTAVASNQTTTQTAAASDQTTTQTAAAPNQTQTASASNHTTTQTAAASQTTTQTAAAPSSTVCMVLADNTPGSLPGVGQGNNTKDATAIAVTNCQSFHPNATCAASTAQCGAPCIGVAYPPKGGQPVFANGSSNAADAGTEAKNKCDTQTAASCIAQFGFCAQ